MKKFAVLVAVFVAVAIVGGALAGEEAKQVTLEGQVLCAMCALKEKDFTDCQNVIQVKKGETTESYYIVKNDVAEKFGHVCSGAKMATVTGSVAEKDGRMWVTPTAMQPVEKG